jgi:L-fuculose-phosphate aldolase
MKILKLSHAMGKFAIGFEGNVSQKIDNNFVIKASGTNLSNLSENELVLCSLDDCQQINNFHKKPSLEVSFHSELLKEQDINFVAHTHPVNTLKILCSDYLYEFAENRIFPDQVVFNKKKSCVVDYASPGNELTNQILISLNKFKSVNNYLPNLFLLQNHGIIVTGKTYQECIIATEICEKAAEIFFGSKCLSNIKFLTKEDVEKIDLDKNEKYRKNILNGER